MEYDQAQAPAPQLNPIKQSERITALDIMRGVVLCGILIMNIIDFGLAGSYFNPTVTGGATGMNLYAWIIQQVFFEGTMRALFSLLFGVGTYIMLERLEHRKAGIKAAEIYFRRLVWLLFFGLVHGYLLLWTGEILYDYALMGFVLFVFVKLPPKKLLAIVFLLVSIGAFWGFLQYKGEVKLEQSAMEARKLSASGAALTKQQKEDLDTWEEIEYEMSPEFVQDKNENMRKGYFHLVGFLAPVNMQTDTYMFYRYGLWDLLSMMLLGIALFKWKVLSGQKPARFYIGMVLIGYVIGISVNLYEVCIIRNSGFSFLGFSQSFITYELGRIPMAVGHIGVIMLFSKVNAMKWLKKGLAAVGKMALTNYIMHSLICMVVFTGVGFGLYGKLQRYELYFVVFSIWVFQLILSPIWLRYFNYGPLEWLWRRLSYRYKPAFKKETS
jgi:uncharacterized protein